MYRAASCFSTCGFRFNASPFPDSPRCAFVWEGALAHFFVRDVRFVSLAATRWQFTRSHEFSEIWHSIRRSNASRASWGAAPVESKCRHPSNTEETESSRPHFCSRDRAPHAGQLSSSAFLDWRKRLPRLLCYFRAIQFSRTPYCPPRTVSIVRESENRPIYGGFDSASGSGGMRGRNHRRVDSCASNGKWITFLAAIVASSSDFVRGRVRC